MDPASTSWLRQLLAMFEKLQHRSVGPATFTSVYRVCVCATSDTLAPQEMPAWTLFGLALVALPRCVHGAIYIQAANGDQPDQIIFETANGLNCTLSVTADGQMRSSCPIISVETSAAAESPLSSSSPPMVPLLPPHPPPLSPSPPPTLPSPPNVESMYRQTLESHDNKVYYWWSPSSFVPSSDVLENVRWVYLAGGCPGAANGGLFGGTGLGTIETYGGRFYFRSVGWTTGNSNYRIAVQYGGASQHCYTPSW